MGSDSAIKNVLAFWCNIHKEQLKTPYCICWGKDQKIIKDIVSTYGQTPTFAMIALFFKQLETDEFLKKTGASLGIFRTQIPKLILKITNNKEKGEIGKL